MAESKFNPKYHMLIQLTYASRTSKTLVPDDLKAILVASQRNNTRVGITGALCLTNGIFQSGVHVPPGQRLFAAGQQVGALLQALGCC